MSVLIREYRVDDLAVKADPQAEVPAAETIKFSVNGKQYEIDLSDDNARGFYKAVRPYQEAGRLIRSPRKSRTTAARANSANIRSWAKLHGHQVNERGRIPGKVISMYNDDRQPQPA